MKGQRTREIVSTPNKYNMFGRWTCWGRCVAIRRPWLTWKLQQVSAMYTPCRSRANSLQPETIMCIGCAWDTYDFNQFSYQTLLHDFKHDRIARCLHDLVDVHIWSQLMHVFNFKEAPVFWYLHEIFLVRKSCKWFYRRKFYTHPVKAWRDLKQGLVINMQIGLRMRSLRGSNRLTMYWHRKKIVLRSFQFQISALHLCSFNTLS